VRHHSARQDRDATLSRSHAAFGRPFAILFLTIATALVALRSAGVISMLVVLAGIFALPVLAACSAIPFAWLSERRIEQRHRRELAHAQQLRHETNLRLLVLQAQIEPHFLFNTLASLRALLREDVNKAEGLVDALVDHLRAVLPVIRNETTVSTLSDQLAICESYLELMSIRLDGRLSYCVDAPDSLKYAAIPPLMLLTLVENAIKHGIEPKPGHGSIRVEARQHLNALVVSVTDDGSGLISAPECGLGLRNLREQLAIRYGEHASLSLTRSATGGTLASILLPHEKLQST
jgi:sensor histidine kinase YesM